MTKRWIGVDFDQTLCDDDGNPIAAMVKRIHDWIAQGIEVRIVTARVSTIDQVEWDVGAQYVLIRQWCRMHIGHALRIQAQKSRYMLELWDDKAVAVEKNTGRRLSPSQTEPPKLFCKFCKKVLVNSDGELVNGFRTTKIGSYCYPECEEARNSDEIVTGP